ncbi:hypothetical protein PPERSA_05133 [Pseudocohnilembus persalinus]|uniref:Uncharacterized protein n=1 Tax=Pseudocohnilembus persalinus TaxID=266149 RepID=A0A0V0QX58_PSEPJ|nr:hypothetical protein PPERSA_05133 [Pseudocohnilembus persalinus]|eukprot:KRX06520.1 hypothetical protein PPERSA_05133 [Pseudocohnilembus persalinus]
MIKCGIIENKIWKTLQKAMEKWVANENLAQIIVSRWKWVVIAITHQLVQIKFVDKTKQKLNDKQNNDFNNNSYDDLTSQDDQQTYNSSNLKADKTFLLVQFGVPNENMHFQNGQEQQYLQRQKSSQSNMIMPQGTITGSVIPHAFTRLTGGTNSDNKQQNQNSRESFTDTKFLLPQDFYFNLYKSHLRQRSNLRSDDYISQENFFEFYQKNFTQIFSDKDIDEMTSQSEDIDNDQQDEIQKEEIKRLRYFRQRQKERLNPKQNQQELKRTNQKLIMEKTLEQLSSKISFKRGNYYNFGTNDKSFIRVFYDDFIPSGQSILDIFGDYIFSLLEFNSQPKVQLKSLQILGNILTKGSGSIDQDIQTNNMENKLVVQFKYVEKVLEFQKNSHDLTNEQRQRYASIMNDLILALLSKEQLRDIDLHQILVNCSKKRQIIIEKITLSLKLVSCLSRTYK